MVDNVNGDVIIYQTDDGLTKIDVRVENETVWLSQQQMAELFGTSRTNIIEHINNIYAEEELDKELTCQNFRQVRKEGNRNVTREIPFYNLDMIISLGYRIKSKIATNFRRWATERLKEYMIKGFTMDDERLKGNGGGNYWKELLARIKDIRSSEKVLYRQVLDLYATAVDYDPKDSKSMEFFKIVQNKLHYATHGHTASEVIYERADAEKPFMGLTTFKGDIPVLQDVVIAKNYLNEEELKVLNNSYPGWIFLPWKMKYKVNRVLEKLDDEWDFFAKKEKLVDISFSMQIEYMYEYVKFLNIVGRPIILETAEKFWDILENSKEKEEKTEYKIQYIYLQLLRAYRELADWEKYDLCRAKILESTLKYEEKQFLYSNDWWMKMYRFKDVNLIDLLNKWDLAQGDLYWPIIKSSMYAIAGEKVKGEQILGEILPKIRQQLVKNSKDEYLCSIEECIVSLLNFMRQGDWQVNLDAEMEACIQTGDVNWWGENEEYCSHLNEKEDKKPETSVQTNYDLSITYTSHMGRCNSKIYYALDYLRFLEQTGHPFRIQMVTNTKGFQRVIETLYLYYPQWCLIQILIAQNEKELDMLFGRNKLSGMTQEEVDNCIQEYIKALDLVSKNIKPENANWSTSVYDNSAKILPQIISRLCYKCSIEILDQILDYMLILCSSNVRDNFKGINKILEGVCNAYTEKEQGERIEKILRFPMKTNERRTYYDPVNYLKRPKEKYKINDDLYNNIIIQIRQLMEIGTAQEKADALQRLIILAQLIYLKQNDEEYLYQCLEKKQTCEHQNILYHLNKERYKLNDDLILKSTLQLMEQDSNKQYFSSHTGSYRELIDILPDVQSDAIDYKKIFSVMTKLIKTNIDRKNDQQTAFQIEERSKQSYRIAVGLLLLKIKKKEIISIEEKEVIEEYFKTLQEYYNASNVLEFIEKLLLEKLNISEDIYTNMEEKLWLHSEEDINLLQIFYLETSRIKINIKQMKRFGPMSRFSTS